jgi:hypothetical protein
MTAYQLQARRAVPGAPGRRREETRLREADDLDAANRAARELAADGFTVWIFRRVARPRLGATPRPLRLVSTLEPQDTDRPERPARPVGRPPAGQAPRGQVVDLPVATGPRAALRRAR